MASSSSQSRLARLDQEVVLPLRWSTALAAALAAACIILAPSTAAAAAACGVSGYAYAGIQPMQNGYGVSVRLTSLTTPVVESGHVAGWVGVGGPGQGPGGSNLWIQVGLNSLPGTGNTLYYEVMRPGVGQTYGEIHTNIPTGQPLRLAVLETATTPGAWRVWVNGRPVTPAIMLAGSHGTLAPMAMGESWDGGRAVCNRYSYRFENVSIAASPGGSWSAARNAAVLQDPGYKVVKRAAASFDAGAVAALAAGPEPAAAPKPATPATPEAATAPKPAAPTQSVAVTPALPVVANVSAPAISADAPLRKGFVPEPSIEAILGVTTQQPTTVTPQPAPSARAVAVTPDSAAPVAVTPVVVTPVAAAAETVASTESAGISLSIGVALS